MTSATRKSRSTLMAGAAATLAFAALGFAGAAEARDNVAISVGLGFPGVQVGVSNAYPVYTQQPVFVQQEPVYVQPQPYYVQPQPVYVQPQPVYVQPRPVYYSQPVYVQPRPVYYGYPQGRWHGGHFQGHNGYSQTGYYRQGWNNGWRGEHEERGEHRGHDRH